MFDSIQAASLGEHALAAVGVASQVKMLFTTVFMAINVGVTVLVAREVGAGRPQGVTYILRQGILLTIPLFVGCIHPVLFVPRTIGFSFRIFGRNNSALLRIAWSLQERKQK